MNREERLARIGQILAKGVTLMAERRGVEAAKQIKPNLDQGDSGEAKAVMGFFQDDVDTSLSIYAFIKRVGSASHQEIQRVLQISKATVCRKVNGHLDAGVITRTGSTTAVRYQIAPNRALPAVGHVRHNTNCHE